MTGRDFFLLSIKCQIQAIFKKNLDLLWLKT